MEGARPDFDFGRPPRKRSHDGAPAASPEAIERTRSAAMAASSASTSISSPLSCSNGIGPVNWFIFEGYVGQARLIETRTGRVMALLDVAQTSHYRDRDRTGASKGRVAWARTWAFDHIGLAAASELQKGDRVICAGNFAAKSKTSRFGFVLRLVTTAFYRVEVCGDTFLNRWEFEGRLASDVMAFYPSLSTHMARFGAWQPGRIVRGPGGHGVGKTGVGLINFRCLGQRSAKRAEAFKKHDLVFMSGHLSTMPEYKTRWGVHRSRALYPFVDRMCALDPADAMDQRGDARARAVKPVIPPALDRELVNL